MKFFIEIGSNCFQTLLPLAKNGWYGIMVEPIKHYFNKIERHPNVIYENIAISPTPGTFEVKFWDPRALDQDSWMHGCGSIDPFLNVFHGNDKLKPLEVTQEVQGLTLNQLIDKHNIKQIDFLKIDTEGLDYYILKSYDWSIKPTFIRIEYSNNFAISYFRNIDGMSLEEEIRAKNKYLSKFPITDRDMVAARQQGTKEMITLLESKGYMVYKEKNDLYAIH
jgi:FkbM family methyltransferase